MKAYPSYYSQIFGADCPLHCNAGGGGGGKGGSPDVPQPPTPEPIPIREREVETTEKSVRKSESNRIKAMRGSAGTILTSPLGSTGGVQTGTASILGKV